MQDTEQSNALIGESLGEIIDRATNFTLATLTEETCGRVAVARNEIDGLIQPKLKCEELFSQRNAKHGQVSDAVLIRFRFTFKDFEREFILLFGDFDNGRRTICLRSSNVVAVTTNKDFVITENSIYRIANWYDGPDELPDKLGFWTHMCSMTWSQFWPDRPQSFFW